MAEWLPAGPDWHPDSSEISVERVLLSTLLSNFFSKCPGINVTASHLAHVLMIMARSLDLGSTESHGEMGEKQCLIPNPKKRVLQPEKQELDAQILWILGRQNTVEIHCRGKPNGDCRFKGS